MQIFSFQNNNNRVNKGESKHFYFHSGTCMIWKTNCKLLKKNLSMHNQIIHCFLLHDCDI